MDSARLGWIVLCYEVDSARLDWIGACAMRWIAPGYVLNLYNVFYLLKIGLLFSVVTGAGRHWS